MSALMHPLTRPEEDQYNIVGHGRAGRGGLHGRGVEHEFLNFLLPLLGMAVKTVAVSAVSQLATNAIGNFVSGLVPTAGVQETGTPVPTYEEVAGGEAITEPEAGVPFEEEVTPEGYYLPGGEFVQTTEGGRGGSVFSEAAVNEGVPPVTFPGGTGPAIKEFLVGPLAPAIERMMGGRNR